MDDRRAGSRTERHGMQHGIEVDAQKTDMTDGKPRTYAHRGRATKVARESKAAREKGG